MTPDAHHSPVSTTGLDIHLQCGQDPGAVPAPALRGHRARLQAVGAAPPVDGEVPPGAGPTCPGAWRSSSSRGTWSGSRDSSSRPSATGRTPWCRSRRLVSVACQLLLVQTRIVSPYLFLSDDFTLLRSFRRNNSVRQLGQKNKMTCPSSILHPAPRIHRLHSVPDPGSVRGRDRAGGDRGAAPGAALGGEHGRQQGGLAGQGEARGWDGI